MPGMTAAWQRAQCPRAVPPLAGRAAARTIGVDPQLEVAGRLGQELAHPRPQLGEHLWVWDSRGDSRGARSEGGVGGVGRRKHASGRSVAQGGARWSGSWAAIGGRRGSRAAGAGGRAACCRAAERPAGVQQRRTRMASMRNSRRFSCGRLAASAAARLDSSSPRSGPTCRERATAAGVARAMPGKWGWRWRGAWHAALPLAAKC